MRVRIVFVLFALIVAVAYAPRSGGRAQEGDWSIRSFEAQLDVTQDGVLHVTEDIYVDIGSGHGIFRDIPVEYAYTNAAGESTDEARLVTISNIAVDDGTRSVSFETVDERPDLRLKIGNPDVIVRGLQRYRIHYDAAGALNPFSDHDELYWNVTGNAWPVPIADTRVTVTLPGAGIQQIDCFEGETGSTQHCASQVEEAGASFRATGTLPPENGLTIILGLRTGLVNVPPLVLVPATKDRGAADTVSDYAGLDPASLAVAVLFSLLAVCAAVYQWWSDGRDRWYGDTYYLSEDAPHEETKPPFAHQTIVVGYTPPEVVGGSGRRLRPAEIGLLLDERADTLDISATIVDLAVRKHIQISEQPAGGVLGVFKGSDYMLSRLTQEESDLLPYEKKLVAALFEGGEMVKMSDLKNKFHDDLEGVKELLYRDVTKTLKLFPRDPESTRAYYRTAGTVAIVAGVALGFGLGRLFGVALLALPVIVGGAALFAVAHAMPRRTASGWETFRRCLGFRLYMVTAETDRQRFAEQANIFHEYLPYAIVMGCVKKWAQAFEGLDVEQSAGYYVGTHPFAPLAFADSMNDFSGSVSGVMASTPGGSGGSGFSGGGFSGGGVGGGGGGRW